MELNVDKNMKIIILFYNIQKKKYYKLLNILSIIKFELRK